MPAVGGREALCGLPLGEWEHHVVTALGFYWACCPVCREEFEQPGVAVPGFIHIGRSRR